MTDDQKIKLAMHKIAMLAQTAQICQQDTVIMLGKIILNEENKSAKYGELADNIKKHSAAISEFLEFVSKEFD